MKLKEVCIFLFPDKPDASIFGFEKSTFIAICIMLLHILVLIYQIKWQYTAQDSNHQIFYAFGNNIYRVPSRKASTNADITK